MSSAAETVLEARDLDHTYDMEARTIRVLRGVSLEVRRGEILAIQGPSGAGKSTLLHLLGLLDEPDRGRIYLRGEDALALSPRERAAIRNHRIGFVFQFYHLLKDLTALENVCLPRMVSEGWFAYHARRDEIEARGRKLLELVGLGARLKHRPGELSGGERQRVAIARALMNEPEIVLCDEPTGNLDTKTAADVLDLIWKLNEETGQTFVVVTHDEALARRAHRAVRIVDGRAVPAGVEPAPPPDEGEVRFRLKGVPPRGGYGRPAVLVFLLCAIPLVPLWWVYSLEARFRRATRQGHRGLGMLLLHIFAGWPPLGWVALPILHGRSLGLADAILHVNGLRRLRGRRAAQVLFGLVWPLTFLVVLLRPLLFGSDDAFYATAAVASVLGGLACAWIQSLHNAFYGRITPESCPPSG